MREPSIIVVSALSLPLIQLIILKLGISLNQDLYHQMTDAAGNDFDGEVFFNILFSVLAQCSIACILGAFAYLSAGFSTRICRWFYFFAGVGGVLLFGLILESHWDFKFDYCTSGEVCAPASPIKFNFVICTLCGLPLLWCLVLMCVALSGRLPVEKRKVQFERYF
jgi:hypothetical protein